MSNIVKTKTKPKHITLLISLFKIDCKLAEVLLPQICMALTHSQLSHAN